MEKDEIGGIPVYILNSRDLPKDTSVHVLKNNIPSEILSDLSAYKIYREKNILNALGPEGIWTGCSFDCHYDGHDRNMIFINDEKIDQQNIPGVKEHEKTHAYLNRKCPKITEYLSEAVAYARQTLCSPEDMKDNFWKIIGFYTKDDYIKEQMEKAFKSYLNASQEIGDDVALQLMKDSANMKTGDPVDHFKETVSDYKLNLQMIFKQV